MTRRALLALVAAVLVTGACTLDEAELFRAGAPQISADPGELRVISYEDDPARDGWVDVVTPDPDVFTAGDGFRERDARTAEEDEAAERRRLFTGVGEGRTLLVVVGCSPCRGDGAGGSELLVWDLVVGDPEQPFSDGTAIARPGTTTTAEVGDLFAVVRPAGAGPATVEAPADALVRIARHEPDDGADLYVDVYLAQAPTDGALAYTDERGDTAYPVRVGP